MDFAALDRRVKLLEVIEVEDPITFAPVETTNEIEVWAELRELKGKENFELNHEQDVGLAIMFIRFRSDIQPHWKVLDEFGRTWRIVGQPKMLGRKVGLEISLRTET